MKNYTYTTGAAADKLTAAAIGGSSKDANNAANAHIETGSTVVANWLCEIGEIPADLEKVNINYLAKLSAKKTLVYPSQVKAMLETVVDREDIIVARGELQAIYGIGIFTGCNTIEEANLRVATHIKTMRNLEELRNVVAYLKDLKANQPTYRDTTAAND